MPDDNAVAVEETKTRKTRRARKNAAPRAQRTQSITVLIEVTTDLNGMDGISQTVNDMNALHESARLVSVKAK